MNFKNLGVRYFKESEFPPGELGLTEPKIILALDEFRHRLGKEVKPSPVAGALARPDKTASGSRHYAISRLSDAVDVFPQCNIADAWLLAVTSGLFGGVGFYLDTAPSPMLHLDLREERLMWARIRKSYIYPAHGPAARETFFRGLAAAAIA